jgi:hypothetical protein
MTLEEKQRAAYENNKVELYVAHAAHILEELKRLEIVKTQNVQRLTRRGKRWLKRAYKWWRPDMELTLATLDIEAADPTDSETIRPCIECLEKIWIYGNEPI